MWTNGGASMSIKYFYFEDDTGVLFAANGTALTALLVGITNIVPLLKFPVPTYPMWLFFLGLIFAFLSKAMIQLINDDTLQREKLQSSRDFIVSALKEPNLPQEMSASLNASWKDMESKHGSLLKPHSAQRIAKLRALFYFISAFCFLIATSRLIYLAGALTEQQKLA